MQVLCPGRRVRHLPSPPRLRAACGRGLSRRDTWAAPFLPEDRAGRHQRQVASMALMDVKCRFTPTVSLQVRGPE